MYIFGYKTTVFILGTKFFLVFLAKCTFIFSVKSTIFIFVYIFRYKATVFIQNLYILVKFFGKNFIISVKSTNFSIFRNQCTFLGTKLQFLSKICTFS